MARRTRQQKLVGWGVLGAATALIIALFLITRLLQGGPPTQNASSPSAAVAENSSSASVPGPSQAPAASSSGESQATAETKPSSAAAPSTLTSEAPSAVSVVDPDSMDQGARKAFLITLINQGIFTGLQALDSPPKIGVTPLFEGLDLTLKQQFIAVAYAYVNNGGQGTQPLQLIDATNGKLFGTYTAGEGLKLL